MGFLTRPKLLFILLAAYSVALLICASIGLSSSINLKIQLYMKGNETNSSTFGPGMTDPDSGSTRGSNDLNATFGPNTPPQFDAPPTTDNPDKQPKERRKRQEPEATTAEEGDGSPTTAAGGETESETLITGDGDATPGEEVTAVDRDNPTTIESTVQAILNFTYEEKIPDKPPTKLRYEMNETSFDVGKENQQIIVGSAIMLVGSIFGLITCVYVLFFNRKKPDIFMTLIISILLLLTFLLILIGNLVFTSSGIRHAYTKEDAELYGPGWNTRMVVLGVFSMATILHVALTTGYLVGKTDQNKKNDKGGGNAGAGSPGPAAPAKSSPSTAAQP